jgi:hypothetical protein
MSSEIFINITKEKKEMTIVQLENEIDCKFPMHVSVTQKFITGNFEQSRSLK